MTEHERMVQVFCDNTQTVQQVLHLDTVWIWATEYCFDVKTGEKADIVFQDKYSAYETKPDTTVWIVEVKSDVADHEVVGQLQKAVKILKAEGDRIRQWHNTKGLAIAKSFTPSGLQLLLDAGFVALMWEEIDGKLRLTPLPLGTKVEKSECDDYCI